jgi:hypothetical protein
MVEYFKKIELDLSDIDLDKLNSGIEKHRPYGLNFSYNKIINQEEILNLKSRIPEEYQKLLIGISYCIVNAPFYVLPHKDVASVNVINYYHKPGNSVTKFFKPLVSDLKPHMFTGNLTGMSYYPEEIEEVCSFVAKSEDCYILNVSEIHSVNVYEGEDRHFISFSFNDKL